MKHSHTRSNPLSTSPSAHYAQRDSTSNTASSRASTFRTLIGLTYPHRRVFSLGLIALTVGSGINLLFPEIARRLLDKNNFARVADNVEVIVLALVALFCAQGVAFFIRSYLFGILGQRVYADLRQRLLVSILARDISFFDANRASDLAARVNSDAALVQDAVAVKLSVITRYGAQAIFGVILMLAMSWKLTAAILASVLVMVLISAVFIKRLKNASRQYQTNLACFTSFTSESFTGVRIARALGAVGSLIKIASRHNQQTLKAGEGRVLWSASFSSGASALLNILLLCVAWYGVSLVAGGTLEFNELAAFVLYGAIVAVSLSFLVSAYAELMQGLGGLERVFELLGDGDSDCGDSDRGDSDRGDLDSASNGDSNGISATTPFGRDKAEIVLQDGRDICSVESVGVSLTEIDFAYLGRTSNQVLRSFSCSVAPGSFTALVGASGVGKSSIAQLICKLYKPQAGRIELDFNGENLSLDKITEASLRKLLAWVPQDPQLFGLSIYDNLVLGNSGLLRDEVLKTLRSWEFLDFLEPLEQGIDTVLGEHGTLLSGGQKQRIAIARALLRKPSLLILDEATSALDSESEERVMRAIRSYIPQATLFIISHRMSSVSQADSIIVMRDGEVVESGTHAKLWLQGGLYRQFGERQVL